MKNAFGLVAASALLSGTALFISAASASEWVNPNTGPEAQLEKQAAVETPENRIAKADVKPATRGLGKGKDAQALSRRSHIKEFHPSQSDASPFVQSRAKVQILRQDDVIDSVCYDKRFVKAQVVPNSYSSLSHGSFMETRWQEQWTMDRCGKKIGYRVFFTEVGNGGVTFAVRQMN